MNKYHFFIGLLLSMLLMSAQPLHAQTCNSNITATVPDSRYTNNGDGTVTDKRTGLMWKQCSEGQSTTVSACDTGAAATYTWQAALQQAQTVNASSFAFYNDWRLPNRNELASLLDRKCYSPSINEVFFPGTVSFYYWTSTSDASVSNYVWYVYFNNGTVASYSNLSNYYTRLVRDE